MDLVLRGTIVPLRKTRKRESYDGRVYVRDGRIHAVGKTSEAAPAGFDAARQVDLKSSYIYPGLIDLHSHLGYNTLPLWAHEGEPKPFRHHDIWPQRSSYKPAISWPAWVLAKAAPEALLTYVQVQALAGGTTSIQGWPSANRSPVNRLIRSVEDQDFGGGDPIVVSTLTLDPEELRERALKLAEGRTFIYHCSEGQVGSIVEREFEELARANCLRERMIAIHCNAVGDAAFEQWKVRSELFGDGSPGGVVWSPFSNLWLYGQTTDIPAARRHGLTVCLGTDWGPSGTKNLLGELKVATLWSARQGWGLEAFDLVEMVTSGPGDLLTKAWGTVVGRLQPGALADLVVVARRSDDPFVNLVEAREEEVELVVVDGEPRYGTLDLMTQAGARRTTSVAVGATVRRTVLVEPPDPDDDGGEQLRAWTWQKVLKALDEVRKDPIGAVEKASALTAAAIAGATRAGAPRRGMAPLVLELEMPGGLAEVAGPPPAGHVTQIPQTPSLRHDGNWRAAIKNRGFHEGVLDDLERFYE
jgi:5-methylthioadenosine/S-adenosylhomocysteine deaminase